ncbi:MAG: 2-oxoglutarate dehydrogenase complex dihydrolipoyllysine-residue succinyltransferase [Ktedonobacteraceae bacterium]
MSAEIRVPTLGESIVDAVIASWLKHEGDAVSKGEAVVELETDKVNVEVTAEDSGVLQKIVKQEGDTVSVGEVLGMIGSGAAEASAPAAETAPPATEAPAPVAETPAPKDNGQKVTPAQAQGASGTQGQRTNMASQSTAQVTSDGQRPPSPLARRIAADNNVDISQIRGTSSHGRVTKDDVIGYLEQSAQPTGPSQRVAPGQERAGVQEAPAPVTTGPAAVPTPQPGRREERVRLSRRRQTIAQRLVEAQHTAAMLTTFNEIDMSAVMEVRARRRDSFKERHNISLGFMSFFTKAVVGALKAFPRLNAEIQGNEMILKRYYDIGIAVGAEEGLVVPVLRDADRKSFADIEREIAELAKKARENTLALSELQGGTFTITNGGIFGSLLSTPILNAPQVGILGMHKIEQRPVALNGQVVIRPMMYVALSYDHRIVDGREAVQFLVRVKELVEDPETLLLEG